MIIVNIYNKNKILIDTINNTTDPGAILSVELDWEKIGGFMDGKIKISPNYLYNLGTGEEIEIIWSEDGQPHQLVVGYIRKIPEFKSNDVVQISFSGFWKRLDTKAGTESYQVQVKDDPIEFETRQGYENKTVEYIIHDLIERNMRPSIPIIGNVIQANYQEGEIKVRVTDAIVPDATLLSYLDGNTSTLTVGQQLSVNESYILTATTGDTVHTRDSSNPIIDNLSWSTTKINPPILTLSNFLTEDMKLNELFEALVDVSNFDYKNEQYVAYINNDKELVFDKLELIDYLHEGLDFYSPDVSEEEPKINSVTLYTKNKKDSNATVYRGTVRDAVSVEKYGLKNESLVFTLEEGENSELTILDEDTIIYMAKMYLSRYAYPQTQININRVKREPKIPVLTENLAGEWEPTEAYNVADYASSGAGGLNAPGPNGYDGNSISIPFYNSTDTALFLEIYGNEWLSNADRTFWDNFGSIPIIDGAKIVLVNNVWDTFLNVGNGMIGIEFESGGGTFEFYYHREAFIYAFFGTAQDIRIAVNRSVYKGSIAPENLVVRWDGARGVAGGGTAQDIRYTPPWKFPGTYTSEPPENYLSISDGSLNNPNSGATSESIPAYHSTDTYLELEIFDRVWYSNADRTTWTLIPTSSSQDGAKILLLNGDWDVFLDVGNGTKTIQFDNNGGTFEFYYHREAWKTAFEGTATPVRVAVNRSVYKGIILPENLVVRWDGEVGPAGGGSAEEVIVYQDKKIINMGGSTIPIRQTVTIEKNANYVMTNDGDIVVEALLKEYFEYTFVKTSGTWILDPFGDLIGLPKIGEEPSFIGASYPVKVVGSVDGVLVRGVDYYGGFEDFIAVNSGGNVTTNLQDLTITYLYSDAKRYRNSFNSNNNTQAILLAFSEIGTETYISDFSIRKVQPIEIFNPILPHGMYSITTQPTLYKKTIMDAVVFEAKAVGAGPGEWDISAFTNSSAETTTDNFLYGNRAIKLTSTFLSEDDKITYNFDTIVYGVITFTVWVYLEDGVEVDITLNGPYDFVSRTVSTQGSWLKVQLTPVRNTESVDLLTAKGFEVIDNFQVEQTLGSPENFEVNSENFDVSSSEDTAEKYILTDEDKYLEVYATEPGAFMCAVDSFSVKFNTDAVGTCYIDRAEIQATTNLNRTESIEKQRLEIGTNIRNRASFGERPSSLVDEVKKGAEEGKTSYDIYKGVTKQFGTP